LSMLAIPKLRPPHADKKVHGSFDFPLTGARTSLRMSRMEPLGSQWHLLSHEARYGPQSVALGEGEIAKLCHPERVRARHEWGRVEGWQKWKYRGKRCV